MNDGLAADSLRLFVALELPERVKDAIESAQDRMKHAVKSANIRWAKRDQFHMTLKFLGNVATRELKGLTGSLTGACGQVGPMNLSAEAIGFFPSSQKPRVVWAGVRAILGDLEKLHNIVEAASAPFTAQEHETSFSGHVTLGRVKSLLRHEARTLADLATTMEREQFGHWKSSEAVLLASELHPDGSRYSRVAALPFNSSS